MLQFLHGGDFHLDSPFRALSPQQAVAARQEQRGLLARFAALAREERVQLCFLTGDLFDGRRVYPETLQALRAMVEALEVPVFIAPGNHDPYTTDSPYARLRWPPHVHIFQSPQVEAVPLPELGCTVYGSAFTAAHRTDSPLGGLHHRGADLAFGCFHGEVTASPSRYGPISRGDMAASGLHYLALGHVHTAGGLETAGESFYAYPGVPQGRGFDETGARGVYVGSTDGTRPSLSFRPLGGRQYRIVEFPLTERGPEEILEALLAAPEAGRGDILRLILTGERAGAEPLPLGQWEALLAPHFYHLELLDRSQPGRDLWARQTEESLLGLFLREMARRLEAASPEETAQLELALQFGLAALEGRDAPP